MLLYAITWPATWLNRRGLPITPQAYENLLTQRLDDIAHHGDPKRYRAYFPRYLLKAIQGPIQFLPEPEFTHRFC